MLHLNSVKIKSITAGELCMICHAIQFGRGNHDAACKHCSFKIACRNFVSINGDKPYSFIHLNVIVTGYELNPVINEITLLQNSICKYSLLEMSKICREQSIKCGSCRCAKQCRTFMKETGGVYPEAYIDKEGKPFDYNREYGEFISE